MAQRGVVVSPGSAGGFTPLEVDWPKPTESPAVDSVTREPVPPASSGLRPHVIASLLAVESTDGHGDRSTFVALSEEALASLAGRLHCSEKALADKWKRIRAHGLGPAYRFRCSGKFVPPPCGSLLCDERSHLLDPTICSQLCDLCARDGTRRPALGFASGGEGDFYARLKWLWLVRMPCELVRPSYSSLVAVLVDLAADFLATHLGEGRRALFVASRTRYQSLGSGCLAMFVNRYDQGQLCGAPLHTDTRCVHGTVVVSLTDNAQVDQLSLCTSLDGAGCYNTTGLHLAGNAVCFGPGVVHGVRPFKRTSTRYSLNVFF